MYIQSMIKISEEEYNKLLQLSKEEAYVFMADIVDTRSSFPPCGYGFSNPSFFEENGNYFVSWRRWGSCD